MKQYMLLLFIYSTMLFAKTPHTAKVTEVLHSGPYSYLHVHENNATYWIAVNRLPVQKGQTITFTKEMQMDGFESKTLKRRFKHLYFADGVRFADRQAPRNPHTVVPLSKKLMHAKISPYKKEGTLSVEEVFANAKKLNGKKIKVRGKVIKVAHEIMKRDWVHIEDGTGEAGTDDLVFTAPRTDLKKGDIVTAEGTVAVEKDFGYGYFYPVIVEKSSFRKE